MVQVKRKVCCACFPESRSHALPEGLPVEGIMVSQPRQANCRMTHLLLQGGESRYCQKCCKPKPPRTHHCKVCKRCVLRYGSKTQILRYPKCPSQAAWQFAGMVTWTGMLCGRLQCYCSMASQSELGL